MRAVFSSPIHFLRYSFLCCLNSIFSRVFHAVVSGALQVDSGIQPKRFKAIMWRSPKLRRENNYSQSHNAPKETQRPGN